MGKIIILDENTSNKIAAGEVIERPASVVKELVENAIDAGADSISVEIKNGGISLINVNDNGSGIEEDDVEIAFERHATSKIRSSFDLDGISTLGFRGEALASIAAVSSVELASRVPDKNHGAYVKIQGGAVKEKGQKGVPAGTTFIIKDLFYNTPARYKFLKKDATEAGYVSDVLTRIALGHPGIAFRLVSNNATVLHTPGNNDLLSTIFSLYGRETAGSLLEINYSDSKFKITGFAGKAEIARSNRNQQSIFINGRYIKSKLITSAIDEAYKTLLMKNKYPFIVMNLEINPVSVDVNVHPTKMEVRFSEEQDVFRSICHAINNALLEKYQIKEVHLTPPEKQDYRIPEREWPKPVYTQQKLEESPKPPNEKVPYINYDKKPAFDKNNFLVKENNIFNEHYTETVKSKESELGKDIVPEVPAGNYGPLKPAEPVEVIEPVTKMEPVRENFTGCKIIGQAFSTYIFLQREEEVLIIDQHAAHERINFEELKIKYARREPLSQFLLSPVVIELTNAEYDLVIGQQAFFENLGFSLEDFGNHSVIVRSVPIKTDEASIKDSFLQVVDQMLGFEKSDFSEKVEEVLYTIACKASIKANMKLDDMEIVRILEDLEKIENPYTCPHGRPTIIKISKNELEKMFKRIV